jgi:ActD protein
MTPPRLVAEFATADALETAVEALRREHYSEVETYAPFDMPALDAMLGRRRSRLGWFVVAAGVAGLIVSYGIQWWANVHSYPLDVGGRPQHAVLAFIPATFEGAVLFAALAAFFGLLIVLRLPKLWIPEDEIEGFNRASIDRFWLTASHFASDLDLARAVDLMRSSGARRVITPEG